MVLILEDKHLESLQCSRCRKYLSVFPVKNHPNREVTCGRCSGIDADEDDSVRSTLYELIAEKYLFKCVNRYEGCREFLRTDETQAHETKCLGNRFDCPKCDDGDGMTVLELIWHYKLRHYSSYLKKNRFHAKPGSDDVMLYVQEDFVFFISMRYESNALYLSAMTLTEVEATQVFLISKGSVWEKSIKKPCMVISAFNDEHQVFNLDSIDSIEVNFNLEVLKTCKLHEISTPSTSKCVTGKPVKCVDQTESKKLSTVNVLKEKMFTIRLAKELDPELGYRLTDNGTAFLNEAGHRIDLYCSNCKQVIGRPIFICKKLEHSICHNCQAWCGICDSPVGEFNSKGLQSKLSSYLFFPCRWKCGGYFNTDLRSHENSCKLKILKCPICLLVVGLSDIELIRIHLLDRHQILNFIKEYNVGQVRTDLSSTTCGEVSFLFHDKCCYLKWSQNGYHNNGYSVYDLNFGLYGNEPNLKLDIVYKNSKLSCNNVISIIPSPYTPLPVPYINFNGAK